MARVVLGERASRIEVDSCEDCPMANWNESKCQFPPGRHLNYVDTKAHDPPLWCPLRGSVLMISGPRGDT